MLVPVELLEVEELLLLDDELDEDELLLELELELLLDEELLEPLEPHLYLQ